MIEVKQIAKAFPISKTEKKQYSKKNILDPRAHQRVFQAVTNVSFDCFAGEVLGLLGPNGAGKTTTLRMLSTAIKPTQGEITINGINIVNKPNIARQKIGFLSGTTGLYRRLTVKENITFMAKLHKLSNDEIQEELDRLFTLLDMHKFANKKADDLSTGMKQKTSIARAVIHKPDIIIFDEPTTGLDVMSSQTILEFIQHYQAKQIPVIFSTHHLHEVEKLCNKIVVINQGASIFNGALHEIKNAMQTDNLYDAFVQLINTSTKH